MTTPFKPLSFDDVIASLSKMTPGVQADEQILTALLDFVLCLPSDHPSKASRVEKMFSVPAFHPDFVIPLIDSDPLQGIKVPSERPAEFVINQYLNAQCSPAWGVCVQKLLDDPRFKPSFDRPLAFIQPVIQTVESGEPFYTFHKIYAYATGYLRAEANHLAGRAGQNCRQMADRIESKMPEAVVSESQFANFQLSAFADASVLIKQSIAEEAARPIASDYEPVSDYVPEEFAIEATHDFLQSIQKQSFDEYQVKKNLPLQTSSPSEKSSSQEELSQDQSGLDKPRRKAPRPSH